MKIDVPFVLRIEGRERYFELRHLSANGIE